MIARVWNDRHRRHLLVGCPLVYFCVGVMYELFVIGCDQGALFTWYDSLGRVLAGIISVIGWPLWFTLDLAHGAECLRAAVGV